MLKLITILVNQYNKKASPENKIEIVKPTTYQARTTFAVDLVSLKLEVGFYSNILEEKKYDLRQQLIKFIHDDGDIEYEVKEEKTKVIVTAKVKVYAKV